MAMTCVFPGIKFQSSVTGYRISCAYTPTKGFQGRFFVYVLVHVDAGTAPGVVDLGANGPPPKGTLQLTGNLGVDHSFPHISLLSTEDIATRREKFRILEFYYDATVSDTDKVRPTLKNTWTRTAQDGQLGPSYKFNLGAGEENLLAFSSRRTTTGGNVLRFSTFGNDKAGNSWFTKIFRFAEDGQAFTIPFAGQTVRINNAVLGCVYLDETFGELLKWPLPPLRRYTDPSVNSELVQMDVAAAAPDRLLADANQRYQPNHLGDIVQTATFFLNDQNERNLQVP